MKKQKIDVNRLPVQADGAAVNRRFMRRTVLLAAMLLTALCLAAGSGIVRAQAGTTRTRVIFTKTEDDFAKETSKLAKRNTGLSIMSNGEIRPYSSGRLIVRVKNGKKQDFSNYNASTVIQSSFGVSILQFSSPEAARKAAKKIRGLGTVSYVEPDDCTMNLGDTKITQIDGGGSDGIGSSSLEGLKNLFGLAEDEDAVFASSVKTSAAASSTARMSWGAAYIQADKYAAYVKKTTKKAITVAVVDSGVSSHKLLKSRLLKGKDFVDNDNDPTDKNGHGTHVAGIIADCTPGINVRILPVRVMNASGVGSPAVVGNGIRYAVQKGAKVINLSLGGNSHYKYLEECISYAAGKGVTIVVAAGNGSYNTGYICPAHLSGPIVVSAIGRNGKRAAFSNYGNSVDIAAPGVGIRSCWKNGGFATADGTSMAAPHISAAAAMYRLTHPSFSPARTEKFLKSYAKDLGAKGNDPYYGRGVPRMSAAIPVSKKVKKKASIDLEKPFVLASQLPPSPAVEKKSAGASDDNAPTDFFEVEKDVRKLYVFPSPCSGNAVIRDGSIVVGERLALDAEIIPAPSGEYRLSWQSSRPDVASVDGDGVVTACKEGSAEITVTLSGTSGAGQSAGDLSGSGTFTVKVIGPSIMTGDASYTVEQGEKQLSLRALFRVPGTLEPEKAKSSGDDARAEEPVNDPAGYVLAMLREDGDDQILLGAIRLEADGLGDVHVHGSGGDGSSSARGTGMKTLSDPAAGKQASESGVLRHRGSNIDGGKGSLSLAVETERLRALAAQEASREKQREQSSSRVSWKCRLSIYEKDAFEEREQAVAEHDPDRVREIDDDAVCSCAFTMKLEIPAGKAADSADHKAKEGKKADDPAAGADEPAGGKDTQAAPAKQKYPDDEANRENRPDKAEKAEPADPDDSGADAPAAPDSSDSSGGSTQKDTDPAAEPDPQPSAGDTAGQASAEEPLDDLQTSDGGSDGETSETDGSEEDPSAGKTGTPASDPDASVKSGAESPDSDTSGLASSGRSADEEGGKRQVPDGGSGSEQTDAGSGTINERSGEEKAETAQPGNASADPESGISDKGDSAEK